MEGAVLAIVLVGTAFSILHVNDKYITTRLWRQWFWWRVPRMDIQSEERAWEFVADGVVERINRLFLNGQITYGTRTSMFKKLQRCPGLGEQFSDPGVYSKLKEAIRERLGTHTTPRFPDPGPYVFSYANSKVGDRLQSPVVLLTMRTGKWRTKQP